MKVVVTGGAGFIGANVVRKLIDLGVDNVVVLDDLSSGFRSNIDGLDVYFREGSILDRDLLDDVVRGADSVIHLAARPSVPRSIVDPVLSHEVNATGTLYVLEAARKHESHVVLASSSSVYGSNPILPKSEDLRTAPISPYAVSKLATESYALAYQDVYEMSVLPFRFFNVYGPLQAPGHAYAAVVPSFVSQALKGEALIVHGDGLQTRDFTFVETVCETLAISAMQKIASTSPVNLAFGSRVSLMEVIRLLERSLGHELKVVHSDPRPGDVRDSMADDSLYKSIFPQIEAKPLNVGLAETIDWMRGLPIGRA
jgi:UDP-glucose 4-epimerase